MANIVEECLLGLDFQTSQKCVKEGVLFMADEEISFIGHPSKDQELQ